MMKTNSTMKLPLTRCVITVAALAMLAACGGGGGGGGGGGFLPVPTSPAASPAPAPASTPAPAPAPAASADAEASTGVAFLSGERSRCGLGALKRVAALDAAAAAHVKYMLLNNDRGHGEINGKAGFTGTDPFARVAAQGYSQAVEVYDENTFVNGRTDIAGFGEQSIRSLLTAPYHLRGLMSIATDVGMAIMNSDMAGTTEQYGRKLFAQLNLGYTVAGGSQPRVKGTVLTYPCDGTTGTFTQLSEESPSPLPSRNLKTSPVGQPIYVVGDAGKSLSLTSALIQEVATGNTVAVAAILSAPTDPAGQLLPNEAIVIPDLPLKTTSSYKVTLQGTSNGQAFTKEFSFTTGAMKETSGT
jgi:uncharacterized protein YkwD